MSYLMFGFIFGGAHSIFDFVVIHFVGRTGIIYVGIGTAEMPKIIKC